MVLLVLCKDLCVFHLPCQCVVLVPFLLHGKGDNAVMWLQ